VVDGNKDPHGGAAIAVEEGNELVGGEVVLFGADGADGEGDEHRALALGHGAGVGISQLPQLDGSFAELVEEIDGDVDAAALDVFFGVTEDVGELEGDAGLFGVLLGAEVGVAEDPDETRPTTEATR
jgi:hypothetical protein